MTEQTRQPTVEMLATTYALESVKQFGPQKFRLIHDAGLTPAEVLAEPSRLPIGGKRGDNFRADIAALTARGIDEFRDRAAKQITRARELSVNVLLHSDPNYPPNLWASNNPVPVLYVRGDLKILTKRRAVACVGSRQIQGAYETRQAEFARYAAAAGWAVVAGFALGADTVAHRAARDAGGTTICVMPSGLDRPFPPENKPLWNDFLNEPHAVLLSEFPLGTAAASLTLRKRNKTIVGLACGVLVGQSSYKGGAMNAYRFGLEQRKALATFSADGTEATSGNALISETQGAVSFPVNWADERAWSLWLDRLSLST